MSSIPVYNHRPMQPSTSTRSNTVTGPTFSIVDSLDTIKHEYQAVHAELIKVRSERDELELKLESQLTELVSIRRSLFDLEAQQERSNNRYEDEIKRLRSDLLTARQFPGPLPPPGIPGPSPRQHGTSVSPAMTESQSVTAVLRDRPPNDRERDIPEREPRDKQKDTIERDLDRIMDQRDAKRHKSRRDYPGLYPSPRPLVSQGSGSFDTGIGSYRLPGPPNSAGSSSSQHPIHFSPPASTMADELKLQHLSPEHVKDGGDWCAIYNPQVKKALDINLVHTFVHATVVCCVQFSADGRYLATGCNRTTQIFDVSTGAKVCVIADESAPKSQDLYIRSVRFSPDGKLIATGAEDHKIRVWEIAKKRLRHVFQGHEQEIYSLDFSNDGRYIVSGSGDKTMRIWNLNDATCRMITIETMGSANQDAGVTSVSISPDGSMVAAGSLDSVIRIWDIASGTLLDALRGHRDSVYSVAFTPDGKGIVSGSLDKSLKFWDLSSIIPKLATRIKQQDSSRPSTSAPVMDYIGHKDFVLSVSASIDNRWLISGSKDRCVHFWDTQNNSLQFVLQGHKNSVISLDTNPLGGMIATGSGDNSARIWTFSPI